ncbi:hypothetical protein KHS38_20215 [Mucilaginibacter sp. Bleaf8]|uniref:hypothetical protein n=1 Tax=Mucilaginibacter sp. Bleaf8 TaxID=2834430 RepID=UPI001BCFAAD1|nr:hypothetical protein [Mucilaginibacter sp. Bleaf8]MBS7566741.1 hypothetical protein [Mucilaginibacter sp. Bleaf8]
MKQLYPVANRRYTAVRNDQPSVQRAGTITDNCTQATGIPNRDDGRMYGIFITTLSDGTKEGKTKENQIKLYKDSGNEYKPKMVVKHFQKGSKSKWQLT